MYTANEKYFFFERELARLAAVQVAGLEEWEEQDLQKVTN